MVAAGCDTPVGQFESNDVYALTLVRTRSLPTDAAKRDAAIVLQELFGTPDVPRWPGEILDRDSADKLVDVSRLERAAGPQSSDEDGTHRGLYREHCVNCHGLAGSGTGPASMLQNPYPRDFRHGVFKWKSTTRGSKPTRQDLRRLLQHGVPGTGMPAFALLSQEDLDALIDYTIYLSVRGEVERRLIAGAVDLLGYEESAPEEIARLSATAESEGGDLVYEVVNRVAKSWEDASDDVVAVPGWTELTGEQHLDSVARGKEVFHGQVANCVGCHGPDGNGEMVTLDFDDWTKEYSTRIGLTPDDRDAIRPFREAGALRPRPILPRMLQDGVFRGGGDPETIYRLITQGIAGTPMPSVEVVPEASGKGLTEEQVWDLVRYLRSLSGREIR